MLQATYIIHLNECHNFVNSYYFISKSILIILAITRHLFEPVQFLISLASNADFQIKQLLDLHSY